MYIKNHLLIEGNSDGLKDLGVCLSARLDVCVHLFHPLSEVEQGQ